MRSDRFWTLLNIKHFTTHVFPRFLRSRRFRFPGGAPSEVHRLRTYNTIFCLLPMRPHGLPYCDHHGWRWEPGQGPSPCIGETASFLLALSVLVFSVSVIRGVDRRVQRAAFLHQSCGYHVHAAQMALSIAQAVAAVAGGMLIARSRGMLCVALALHSVVWSFSWAISAFAMRRSPRSCRHLLWFWCCALVSNR